MLLVDAGAGVAFVGGASNVSLAFVKFKKNRCLGLGTGVLAVSDRSHVTDSHSHFIENFIDNQMGLVAPEVPSASCITAEAASVSATYSVFETNTGGDVILARVSATLDVAHTSFRSNGLMPASSRVAAEAWDAYGRRRLASGGQTVSRSGSVIALADGATAHIRDTTFSYNKGLRAGAITVVDAGTMAYLEDVLFQKNMAAGESAAGGALFASDQGTIRGSHATFDQNTAASQVAGGAVYVSAGADVVLTDSALVMNEAKPHAESGGLYGAGAVYANQAHLRLIRTNLQDNIASGKDTQVYRDLIITAETNNRLTADLQSYVDGLIADAEQQNGETTVECLHHLLLRPHSLVLYVTSRPFRSTQLIQQEVKPVHPVPDDHICRRHQLCALGVGQHGVDSNPSLGVDSNPSLGVRQPAYPESWRNNARILQAASLRKRIIMQLRQLLCDVQAVPRRAALVRWDLM